MKIDQKYRQDLDSLFAGLRTERYSWFLHWREVADYILPRRYRWFISPNQMNRGSPINQHILDATGTIAARDCASGMMQGITSPLRPWFKLALEGFSPGSTSNPVSLWLAEVEKRMLRVFAESNVYTSLATMYLDLVNFGTAPLIIYEDYEDVIRCYNTCAGEYFLWNNETGRPGGLAREFVRTIKQVVDEFGIENCSNGVRSAFKNGGAEATREVILRHMIRRNDGKILPSRFRWMEVYWEVSGEQAIVLRARGFYEQPFIAPRWDITANDAYGRSPGMDALADVKQLQLETRRKAQAIDKLVNPPMQADITMKNQPASMLPGGITYVTGFNQSGGMKPLFTVNPPVREIMEDIAQVQERIKRIFFNDLFMMISQLQTVRSATEIDARREEKLIMLGPVLERFQNEALDPLVDRVFGIMFRGGLLPPPPQELAGQTIEVQYKSMLFEAQRAARSGGLERFLALGGNLAGINPPVLDKIDFDAAMDEYADSLGVSPRVVRDEQQVAQLRQQRAQAQQMQEILQIGVGGAQAAKAAGEADIGGGRTLLQQLTGG